MYLRMRARSSLLDDSDQEDDEWDEEDGEGDGDEGEQDAAAREAYGAGFGNGELSLF